MQKKISEIQKRIKNNRCPNCENLDWLQGCSHTKYINKCRKTLGHESYIVNASAYLAFVGIRSEIGKAIKPLTKLFR